MLPGTNELVFPIPGLVPSGLLFNTLMLEWSPTFPQRCLYYSIIRRSESSGSKSYIRTFVGSPNGPLQGTCDPRSNVTAERSKTEP